MAQPGKNEILIDGTFFAFPPGWSVEVFDQWTQYTRAAGAVGMKGVDVVAIDARTLWLIEMKDYTYPGAAPPDDLDVEVARKAIGTLALLYALERSASDSAASDFARRCRQTTSIHLALHVDVKDGGRKGRQIRPLLMPIQDEVGKAGKALGLAKTWVTSTLQPTEQTPWTARRDPSRRRHHSDR